MNIAEIAELLAWCAAFDQRTIGEADAEAWHSVLGDLPFDDARDAVKWHYQHETRRVMPADIRDRVRTVRMDRIQRAGLPEVPGHELTDDTGAYKQAVHESVSRLAGGWRLDPLNDPNREPPSGPTAEYYRITRAMYPNLDDHLDPTAKERRQREKARAQVAELRRERAASDPGPRDGDGGDDGKRDDGGSGDQGHTPVVPV